MAFWMREGESIPQAVNVLRLTMSLTFTLIYASASLISHTLHLHSSYSWQVQRLFIVNMYQSELRCLILFKAIHYHRNKENRDNPSICPRQDWLYLQHSWQVFHQANFNVSHQRGTTPPERISSREKTFLKADLNLCQAYNLLHCPQWIETERFITISLKQCFISLKPGRHNSHWPSLHRLSRDTSWHLPYKAHSLDLWPVPFLSPGLSAVFLEVWWLKWELAPDRKLYQWQDYLVCLLYNYALCISQNNICFFHNMRPLLTHAELMSRYSSRIFATSPLISHQVFRRLLALLHAGLYSLLACFF